MRDFVNASLQTDKEQGLFELERDRILEINLTGDIWTKTGSMIAYVGEIRFEREGILEQGVGNLMKKFVSGEGTRLTKASGQGKLYLADAGKKVTIICMRGESIFVNANDVLAFETSLKYDIRLLRKVAAMLSGGLFNARFEGTGLLAVTSHYDPLTLRVTPQQPVFTDPNATIAWSGNLEPEFRTDVSFKTFLGRGSGESLQMKFQGDGFVVVQPFEETYMQQSQ
ncbi:MAG: AIM24 family protein [Pirellula sp.]|nr:AIM24 family protein [Pirellula sp.]